MVTNQKVLFLQHGCSAGQGGRIITTILTNQWLWRAPGKYQRNKCGTETAYDDAIYHTANAISAIHFNKAPGNLKLHRAYTPSIPHIKIFNTGIDYDGQPGTPRESYGTV
jgi:hypothetical protein